MDHIGLPPSDSGQTKNIAAKTAKSCGRRHGLLFELSKNRMLYLMFVPVALYFILFAYIPMTGIVMAFKDFNYKGGIWMSPWNGLENFKYFFVSGKAWLVTRNTVMYNVVFLACYTIFSIIAAILISEMTGKYFKKIAQSFMFLPYFISWVVVAAFAYNFLNYDYGFINNLLKSLGGKPVDFYSNSNYWYFILPFLYVWKWVGFGSVLYLAAIMGMDQECFEAATIDGANVFQKIRYITLPMLRPTVIILVLLGVGKIMRGEFDMFYNLIGKNSLLINSTDIIDTFVFRSLVSNPDFGMASSAGLYQSVLCFVIILVFNGLARRFDRESALF
jgi:putative aldouronate transport system permease protein